MVILMKVNELQKELKGFNPNANISLTDSEDICLSYISEDGADPMTTKQVFIEPCDFCQKCQFYDDGYCRVYAKNCEDVIECFQFNRKV